MGKQFPCRLTTSRKIIPVNGNFSKHEEITPECRATLAQSRGGDSIRAGATARLHQPFPKSVAGGQDRRLSQLLESARRIRRQTPINFQSIFRHEFPIRAAQPPENFYLCVLREGAMSGAREKFPNSLDFFAVHKKMFPAQLVAQLLLTRNAHHACAR